MMPNWAAPSEVWMERMMEALGSDLGAIVVGDSCGATLWRNQVRVASLRSVDTPVRGWSRLLRRFGLRLVRPGLSPTEVLLNEIGRPGVSHVLCHYGEWALRFMPVWRAVDIPLFVHFHGYDATFDLCSEDDPTKRYFSDDYVVRVQELSGRATLIANSQITKSLLVNAGVPAERVHVKYLGVPCSNSGKQHARTTGVRILHLGRLVDFKSPDRTVRAFEMARARGLDGELFMAGDGLMRVTCEVLRARSPYKDSIHLVGAVSAERAQELLTGADIFTQHNIKGEISRQEECFGVSIVEAMAAGLPVVGTRSGGAVETVLDGKTGFLVAPGDTPGQCDALLRLAASPKLRQRLGDCGRERVRRQFSPEGEARILRSILGLDSEGACASGAPNRDN